MKPKRSNAVEYSYGFRPYLTREQEKQICKNFGCCRYVFTHFLNQSQKSYKETGKSPFRYEQDKSLTGLKNELLRLKEADSTSLQASLQDLDRAYQDFFRQVKHGEKLGTQFKSKNDSRQSYKSKCVGTNMAGGGGSQ